MKLVVTGVDSQGRSTVLERREVLPDSVQFSGYARRDEVWQTREQPFELVSKRPAQEGLITDLGVSVGGTKWMIVELKPLPAGDWHRTDTLDYDVVLRGEVTLELEAVSVILSTGDSVIVSGVVHRWVPGPEGVAMSVVALGVGSVN